MELLELALPILFRWMHMIAAGMLFGSVFFFHVVLPLGVRGLDPEGQQIVYSRLRRGFKMTVHMSLLLFLVSGIYNAVRNWPAYHVNRALMHGLFGLHVLLGLGAITALMVMLGGREGRPSRTVWTRWVLMALALGIAAASALKLVRG